MPRRPQLPCVGGRKRDGKESEAEANERARLLLRDGTPLERRQKASSIELKARESSSFRLGARLVGSGAGGRESELSHLCLSGVVVACEGGGGRSVARDEARKERKAGGDGEKKEK